MKAKVKVEKEVNFILLRTEIGARYWEDATVNGIVDTDGTLIPLRKGNYWCPIIEIDTGIIKDWPIGTNANIHYKCCDDGDYWLIDDAGNEYKRPGFYVPKILDIYNDSYGDYVKMNIDENGKIQDWPKIHDITEFFEEN